MSTLQKYLELNQITRYQISKKTGITQSSLQSTVESPRGLAGVTVKTLTAIATALEKTPGQVLDELIELDSEQIETQK
ncbi:helix-turn-helix transcriptional regulator [Lactobacillus sp. DCY120]|uniref:Helix-turn-helix transcriptional regulator n=1 Tax=Bombilactobacillus apium TaxID=2675299 RepID=A0A850R8Z2_9LACO|nr:helix-turn-helix domain-containing protein [Bombilactobacillus apium]NVY96995.1 helix-turn-helix transcriptional regulator [Bombilactobacillus apium]